MKCEVCGDDFLDDELPWGMCEDCQDDFDRNSLEEKLEEIGII
jgi:hypothetical protein